MLSMSFAASGIDPRAESGKTIKTCSNLTSTSGSVRQPHDRSRTRVLPMLVCKYMNQNGLAAMLITKRSAGIAPEDSIAHRQQSTRVRESTLALRPRAHVTRSPKQRNMAPTKMNDVLQKV